MAEYEVIDATKSGNSSAILVKSVVLTEKGSFDHVKVIDWPIAPKCDREEVRVTVEYCGVNFADVYHVQGKLVMQPTPYILGLECAGKVSEIGATVTEFKVGDRVVCYRPDGGMFRQSVVVPSSQCFLIPESVVSKIACSLLANYLTAFFALCEIGNLRNDQSVLINSAAGGVGWAATQLATNFNNVKIFGTASISKHQDIMNNGVTVPLTYESFMNLNGQPEFDLIIDNIGGENIRKSISLLRPLGRVIITGANCVVQEDESKVAEALESLRAGVDLQSLVVGNKSVCGLHLGTLMTDNPQVVTQCIENIFRLYLMGKIEPRVHTVYPFSKVIPKFTFMTTNLTRKINTPVRPVISWKSA